MAVVLVYAHKFTARNPISLSTLECTIICTTDCITFVGLFPMPGSQGAIVQDDGGGISLCTYRGIPDSTSRSLTAY